MARPKTPRQGYPSDPNRPAVGADRAAAPSTEDRGRPEKHPRRLIVDAILYVVRTGC
jgi:hypothetical protein